MTKLEMSRIIVMALFCMDSLPVKHHHYVEKLMKLKRTSLEDQLNKAITVLEQQGRIEVVRGKVKVVG